MILRIVAIPVLLVVGCAPARKAATECPLNDDGHVVLVRGVDDADGTAVARSIVMPDGTRCVAIIGYMRAGISCDWGGKEQVE